MNGIKCYENKLSCSRLDKNHPKYKPLHLSKSYNAASRMESKLLAKADWFKKRRVNDEEVVEPMEEVKCNTYKSRKYRRDGKKVCKEITCSKEGEKKMKGPTTVMFVPWTIKGRLAGALKREEDRISKLTGFRIKQGEPSSDKPKYGMV